MDIEWQRAGEKEMRDCQGLCTASAADLGGSFRARLALCRVVRKVPLVGGLDDGATATGFGTTLGAGVHLLGATSAEVELDLGQLAHTVFQIPKRGLQFLQRHGGGGGGAAPSAVATHVF